MLHEGLVTDREYFTAEGDLLLSKGVAVKQHHIDALRRRNVLHLWYRDSAEEDEISRLLSADIKSLDKLELDDAAPAFAAEPPGAMALPAFKNIRPGAEGVAQLARSARARDLDDRLQRGETRDTPSGPALNESATRMSVDQRTESYKTEVSSSYREALATTRSLLISIANGERTDGAIARSVSERFVRTFLNDRDILMNISMIQSTQQEYIFHHSLNVCLLSINIAAAYGYSHDQVVEIGIGALLHDVGMLLAPSEIRLKEGRLTQDEWFEIQKHPIMGLHLLESVTRLPDSAPFVAYQAHERENGKGYPKRRSGRFLHAFARIVQIADVFEALCAPRAYRPPKMPYKAMEMIIKMTRQGLAPGQFVKAFLSYASLFPVGSFIELNDHRIARVVAAHPTSYAKPTVSVMLDASGNRLTAKDIYQVDLAADTSVQVLRALDAAALPGVSLMEGF
jgi:HD-GYP domain-containing protein (c-di-GMP phosphodiesterase class II)